MTLFSNKKIEKLFFTKNSSIKINKPVDLVLSPEFYWVRVFEIPVENSAKSIKLLPTLFEDIVPAYEPLHYHSIKLTGNDFLCFAFNTQEILETIKNSGIKSSQINHIYFAQNYMKEYDAFIIDDSAFMYEKDILIKVPKAFCKDALILNSTINTIAVDKPIDLKQYSSFISDKLIYTLCALFFFVIILNLSKHIFYDVEMEKNLQKIELIKEQNQLPATSFQLQSILENMRIEKNLHKKFNDALFFILNFKSLFPKDSIEKLNYKDGRFILLFKSQDGKKIRRYMQTKLRVLSSSSKNGFTRIEVSI